MSKRRVRVDTPGLNGQVDVFTSFEADLLGTRHSVEYRSRLRRRLTFKVTSTLDDPTTQYVAAPNGDSISAAKDVWTHAGQTKTGSRAYSRPTALVNGTAPNGPIGSVDVRYECAADAPFSAPHFFQITAAVS